MVKAGSNFGALTSLPSLPTISQIGALEDASLLLQSKQNSVSFNPFSLPASMARGGSSGNPPSALYTPIPPPDMIGVNMSSVTSRDTSMQTAPTLTGCNTAPSQSDTQEANASNLQQRPVVGSPLECLSFGPDGPTLRLEALAGKPTTEIYSSTFAPAKDFKSRVLQTVPDSLRNSQSWLGSVVGQLFHSGDGFCFERRCAELFDQQCSTIAVTFTYTVFYYLMNERTERNPRPTVELKKSLDPDAHNKEDSFTVGLNVQIFLKTKVALRARYAAVDGASGVDDADKSILRQDKIENSLKVSLRARTHKIIMDELHKAYKANENAILAALQREAAKHQAVIWVAPGGTGLEARLMPKDPENHAPKEVVHGGQFKGADEEGNRESLAE
ncbi:hypothetical protein QFC22_004469 [Naganishia vaughanmartiniae]|uniref:Uncharacterized protein n=1 Tax=Naganishia vaughanmartiniae TaxID=1424756 RepID=A0ACC2X2H4_9TREE|nr:hypothetical protein QFC22_004469 [Naganishia vaughanmartiniae]